MMELCFFYVSYCRNSAFFYGFFVKIYYLRNSLIIAATKLPRYTYFF